MRADQLVLHLFKTSMHHAFKGIDPLAHLFDLTHCTRLILPTGAEENTRKSTEV